MPAWTGKWAGGRFYDDRRGRRVFVIERIVDKRRYTIKLPGGVADPSAELALFLRDPEGYREQLLQAAPVASGAVMLTTDEITAFGQYLQEKHRVPGYVSTTSGYLAQWLVDLAGRDLRRVTVAELYAAVGKHKKGKGPRMRALRTFMGYLVRQQRLALSENASALLEVPRPAPARLLKNRGYSIEQVEKFYAALDEQRARDCFVLGAKYAMHQSEVARIAKGEVELTELSGEGEIRAVIRFVHKSRYDHPQSIDAQALAAVKRLMAAKAAPSKGRLHEAVLRAAKKLNVSPVHPKYLRHSSSTWMEEVGREVRMASGGVSPAVVASVIGHRSMLMFQDHYRQTKVPVMIALPLSLRHPEDPAPLQLGADLRKVRDGT